MPSVSVVVLCRNQESNLAQILAALDSQTLRPAEVIIADDRSVGHIEAVAARSGCRYVSTAPHLGDHRDGNRALTRQIGAISASHDLIAYLDGDIIPSCGFLQIGAEVARLGKVVRAPRRVARERSPVDDLERCLGFAEFTSDSFVARRPDVLSIGGWDERFEGWGEEDVEFAYRCEREGLPIVQVEHAAFFGRHLDHPVDYEKNFASLLKNAAYFTQKHPRVQESRGPYWQSMDMYLAHYYRW